VTGGGDQPCEGVRQTASSATQSGVQVRLSIYALLELLLVPVAGNPRVTPETYGMFSGALFRSVARRPLAYISLFLYAPMRLYVAVTEQRLVCSPRFEAPKSRKLTFGARRQICSTEKRFLFTANPHSSGSRFCRKLTLNVY
jgi:hypothetical protein